MNAELVALAVMSGALVVSVGANVISGGAIAFVSSKNRSLKGENEAQQQHISSLSERLHKAGFSPGWNLMVDGEPKQFDGLPDIVKERSYKRIGTDDDAVYIGIDPDNRIEIVVHHSDHTGHRWASTSLENDQAVHEFVDAVLDASTKVRDA